MPTTSTTSPITFHAPTPRPASLMMLNTISALSNASVKASSQPPTQPSPARSATGTPLTRLETRRLLREKFTTAISRRIDASKNTIAFPSSPRRGRQGRSSLTTTIPRIPLSPTVALHNAERRASLIPLREKAFKTRPRPAARGKHIVAKVPTLLENEVHPPPGPSTPPTPTVHPIVKTKVSLPLPRHRRPATDENTIPFPTEMPALPSALLKARRTARVASYSASRVPFAQRIVQ